MAKIKKRPRKRRRPTAGGAPPKELPAPTVNDIPLLLEALQKLSSARLRVNAALEQETGRLVFALAQEGGKDVSAAALVLNRKLLDDAVAKHVAQTAAIVLFDTTINRHVQILRASGGELANGHLTKRLSQLKDQITQQPAGNEVDTEAIKLEIERITKMLAPSGGGAPTSESVSVTAKKSARGRRGRRTTST